MSQRDNWVFLTWALFSLEQSVWVNSLCHRWQMELFGKWKKIPTDTQQSVSCKKHTLVQEAGSAKSVLFLQVLRSGAVGDRHAGGAAVPGHDQRAGAALRHGRGAAGKARQLSRHAVSATTAPRAQPVPPDPPAGSALPSATGGAGREWQSASVNPVFYENNFCSESHQNLSSNKQTKSKLLCY